MCLCSVCGADGTSAARYPVVPPRGSLMCYSCLELKNLEAQIEDTRAFLNHLKAHVDALRCNHNHIHDYFTHQLPPEIASHIFVYSISGGITQCQPLRPLTLGAVSRRWRQIAWSTPRLWTLVEVNLNRFEESFHRPKELLLQWLARCGQLPLSIRISYDEANSSPTNHIINFTNVIDIISEYASRWEYLNLSMPFFLFPRLRGTSDKTPILQCLIIKPSYHLQDRPSSHKGEAFDISTIPPLPDDVSIDGFPFTSLRIDWANVTNVQFGDISVVHLICLLQQARCLSHCSVDVHSDGDGLHLDNPIILPCLAEFKFAPSDVFAADDIFDNIALPVLKAARYSAVEQQYTSFASLLIRSACLLTSLSITSWEDENVVDDQSLLQLLWQTTALEDLHLSTPSLPKDFFIVFAVPHLLDLDPVNQNLPILLPRLRRLIYNGKLNFSWFYFTRSMDTRRELRGDDGRPLLRSIELRLTAVPTLEYYIHELPTAHICRLIERGIDVKIMNDSKNMLLYSTQFHERRRFGNRDEGEDR